MSEIFLPKNIYFSIDQNYSYKIDCYDYIIIAERLGDGPVDFTIFFEI